MPTIDALARQAAQISRRRSLLTLGGAVLATTTAAAVEPASARKHKKNNNGKNGGKGNGGDCQKKERQRCSNDAEACKASVQPLCNEDNVEQCLAIQTCCEECSAAGFLTCLLAAQPS